MTKETKIWFLNKIVDYLFEADLKPLLEMDIEVSDLYDAGIITHEDFYNAVDALKSTLKKRIN